jgi:hypothetical protein
VTDHKHAIGWRTRCRTNIANLPRAVPEDARVLCERADLRRRSDGGGLRVRKAGGKLRFFMADGAYSRIFASKMLRAPLVFLHASIILKSIVGDLARRRGSYATIEGES